MARSLVHASSAEVGYRVGDLVIDVSRHRVTRAETEIPLSPRSFEFLLALARAAPEVVTYDELMKLVWRDAVVGPEAISQRARIVREALGDTARAPRYVAGVRGRGYRMTAAVEPLEPQHPVDTVGAQPTSQAVEAPAKSGAMPDTAPGTMDPREADAARRGFTGSGRPASHGGERRIVLRRRLIAAALVLLLCIAVWLAIRLQGMDASARDPPRPVAASQAASLKSIAVLPFEDLSPTQDQEHFSDGLAEELVIMLGRNRALRVVARTSSFSFKGRIADVPTIAQRLRATHVLEGSVRRAGDEIRINARLIDASTNTEVWSQTFDRNVGDIFAIQEEIATSVARALQATLAATRPRPSVPEEARAYESFLRARYFHNRRGPGDIARARQYYRRTLAVAPDFARAWSGLAGVHALELARGSVPREAALSNLREAALKALTIDPQLAEAHFWLGRYYEHTGDAAAAARELHQALALDPDDPLMLSVAAHQALDQGRLERAIELQRRAAALDPTAFTHRVDLAGLLAADGRLTEAKAEYLEALELNPTHSSDDTVDGKSIRAVLVEVLVLLRQLDDASALIREMPPGADRDQCLALLEHARGREAEAAAALRELTARYGKTAPLRVAEVHAFRGEADEAFQWLAAAGEQFRRGTSAHPTKPTDPWWAYRTILRASPLLRPLRADPRWEAKLAQAQPPRPRSAQRSGRADRA